MESSPGSTLFRVLTGLFRFVLLPVLVCLVLLGVRPLVLGTVFAEEVIQVKQKPRTKVTANRFIDRVVNGEHITYLLGNVFIDRDSLTARSDTARHYRDREVYEFLGHVVLTMNEGVLTCRHAFHDRKLGTADFYGDVRLKEGDVIGTGRKGESRSNGRYFHLIEDALLVTPDYTVRADTISRDRQEGTGEAFGNVRIMEPGSLNLVTGDHAFFDGANDLAEVDQNPVLTSHETAGDLLTSTAGVMRFFRQENRVVMIDSVRIRQGNVLAIADTAVAFGREHMVLTGSPEVSMSESNTMIGDRIEFFYLDGKIDRVLLIGTARMEDSTPDSLAALYQGLPRMDVLEGDSISIKFEDEEIHRSVVVGSAHSLYTPTDLNDEVATNDVLGDTITIDFRNRRVNRVDVVGKVTGTYQFAKLEAMRDMLNQSDRLVDMLRRSDQDSTAFADSLLAVGIDSSRVAMADSLIIAYVDSLAGNLGMGSIVDTEQGPGVAATLLDSLMTAAMDSLGSAGYDTSAAGLDFLANAEDVKYQGGRVVFEMDDKAIDIQEDGQLEYGTMKLTAQHIKLSTVDRELYAEGNPLIEDSENIAGHQMGYDFRNRTGAVKRGMTSFDGYYYVGEEIQRFPDSTLKICDARMTSCDLEEPHYHFWADKMKMRMEDKVVAKPIVLHIGHVPIFPLPFYFKSLKSGRQSGILFPSFDFGWSSREGRYIRDFGYYWATNDYMDFIFEADYNERRDFAYRIGNSYIKRYAFNGGLNYSRKIGFGEDERREWQFRWNHNQPTLFDDYKFRSDVKMASTSLSSNDLAGGSDRDIVSGEMKSSVYLSRNFSFMSSSLDGSRKEYPNAEDDDPTTDNTLNAMTLPSMSLNFREFHLAKSLRGGQKGSTLGDLARNTTFKQGYNFKLNQSNSELLSKKDYNAGGNWSLSLRPPRLSIFNVSLSSSASQSWQRKSSLGEVYIEDTDTTGHFEDFEDIDEKTNTSLRVAAGVGTSLYGTFPIKVGRLQALRHTLRLNSSYNLNPGLAGGRQAHSTSVGLSLNNRFDLKYLGGDADSTLTEKKLDGLLDWGLSTNYSPKNEPGDRWGIISSNLSIKPGKSRALSLKVANSIDPKTLSLQSTRFNYGLSFSGRADVGAVTEAPADVRNAGIDRLGVDKEAAADSLAVEDEFLDRGYEDNPEEYFDGEESSYYDFYNKQGRKSGEETKDPTEGGQYIPFNVNAAFSYSYTNQSHAKRFSGNLGVNATLTRTWQFNYSGSFDLVTGTPTRQQFGLKKDLHCWALEFNRTVSNVNNEFGFRIYLKSIPALKMTRGIESGMGGLSSGLNGGF
jgi:lipopolysaccharide export system protein LptA